MEQILVDMPDELIAILDVKKEDLPQQLKIWTIVQMFQQGKISVGHAAKLADMKRIDFETFLSMHHIPLSNTTWEELQEELSMVHEKRELFKK